MGGTMGEKNGSGSSPSKRRWSFRIATIRGIPVEIHASFLLLMAFLGWRTVVSDGIVPAVVEQAVVLAVFVCVALHELGHAAVAVRSGVPISGITLYPFGGVARMTRRPPRGMVEVAIASAGPAVNLAIAAALFLISAGGAAAPGDSVVVRLVSVLFWANLILAGFNLVPAFPLDGGRILRGMLTVRLGWAKATVWAASAGQVAGVLLIITGFMQDAWLIFAGVLILPAANAELRYALALRQFADRTVGEIARPSVIPIDLHTTVSGAAELSLARPEVDFLVVDQGRLRGYLPAARLWSRVRSDEPGARPAAELAEPLAAPIPAEAPIEEAIDLFSADGPAVAAVVDADGTAVGVVALGDLHRAARLARHASSRA
jgi:stage IV sporulation protein FB